jgi:hemolysin III
MALAHSQQEAARSDVFVSKSPPLLRPYDSSELEIDRAIHVVGIIFGVVAAFIAVALAIQADTAAEGAALGLYALGLAMMLGFSAAYHLSPASRVRDLFRRLDHAAIFIMIAGTCSAFTLGRPDAEGSLSLTGLAWLIAIGGVVLKLVVPHRLEQISVIAYIAVGLISVLAIYPMFDTFDDWTTALLLIGAALYLIGTAVHLWSALRFQNAIWHAIVVIAAASHYAAIVMARL